jgi:hypothetical protein
VSRRSRLAAVAVLLLVPPFVLVQSSVPLQAQSATPPAAPAVKAVWVAESGGVVKVNAADAAILFEVADQAGVRTLAADDPRGRVWAYSPAGTLRAYLPDGTIAVSLAVPAASSTTRVALVVHPGDGSVWLAVGTSLQHFTSEGQPLGTALTLVAPIRVLALDPPRARIWVGTAKSLEALNDAGQVVVRVVIGSTETLLDAVVEPRSGHVWAGLDRGLRRFDLSGAMVLNVLLTLSSQRWVAPDGAGGVWAATPTVLVRVTGTGQLAVFKYPWSGPGPIVALVADPTDQTAWVASPSALTHVGPTGVFLHQVSFWAGLTVRDLAFARDLVAPEIRFTAPLDGAALNTSTPHLELSYSDLGAGVDPATLALTASPKFPPLS